MATKSEINNFLKSTTLRINSADALQTLRIERGENVVSGRTISDFFRKNAKYIDIKKLVLLELNSKNEFLIKLRESGASEKELDAMGEELYEMLELAKTYIKPKDMVIAPGTVTVKGEEYEALLDSRVAIYGEEIKNENKKYDKIKDFIPDMDIEDGKEGLKFVFGDMDKVFASDQYVRYMDRTLLEQGYSVEELTNIYETELRNENMEVGLPKKFLARIDKEKYNKVLKGSLESLKAYVNAEKYFLYSVFKLNEKLESKQELTEQEKVFCSKVEEFQSELKIPKDIKIEIGKEEIYDNEQVGKFLTKWDKTTGEYYTSEQIKNGEALLENMRGYENYIKKDKMIELAKLNEENLLYLVQKQKLITNNIINVVKNSEVSKNTLKFLYQNENISLKQLTQLAEEKGFPIEKQELIKICIENSKTKKEELESLFDIEEVTKLYKQIYNENNTEKVEEYKNLIEIYQRIGKKQDDEIITLLEEQFGNEMLGNLYKDNLIRLETLESYADEELITTLHKNREIKENDIRRVLNKYQIKPTKKELTEYLQKNIIMPQDLNKLYLSHKVSLEAMQKVDESLDEDKKLGNYITEEELATLYLSTKGKTKAENNEKYQRYRLLYTTLKQEKSDEKIINSLKNSRRFLQDDLLNLYEDNILTLDTVLKYGGEQEIKILAVKGVLKPKDLEKYFAENEQSKEPKVDKLLEDVAISPEQKLAIIYNAYSEDEEMRNKLVAEYLDIHEMSSDRMGKNNSIKTAHNSAKNKEVRKTVTDPFKRLQLMEALDENYTQKFNNGYFIVNLDKTPKTIIEQIYTRRKGKIVPAYGTATFVLDTEKYVEEFSEDKDFDIQKLRRLAKENPAEIMRITHHASSIDKEGKEKNGWSTRLLKAIYGDEEEIGKIYSLEDLEKIQECAKEIETSRKDLEETEELEK